MNNYLPDCLNSIWKQSIDSALYEVICVDDGSTDQTLNYLNSECKQHPNLHILAQPRHEGGRDKGVLKAQGKYIIFIDQDDYFHEDSIIQAYTHLCKNDLEVLITESAYQFRDRPHNNFQLNLPNKHIVTGEEFILTNGFVYAPWRFIIRRDFYLDNNLFFLNVAVPDVIWSVNTLFHVKQIQYQPILLLHYNKAESGFTDNMYRNYDSIKANTFAGNYLFDMSHSNFANSVKEPLLDLADTYYNFSCKYMLGLYASYKSKKELVNYIKASTGKRRWVKLAKQNASLYALISLFTVPLFRIARYYHRKHFAKKLQNNNR